MAAPKKKTPAKSTGTKDTIYVDVDDEITHIIDKLKASDAKIVALILPKRATVLQSIVNMKLLKKAAVNSKKNLVLITSEAGLMPLAGAAGIHVAKSLSSKPVIPPAPHQAGNDETEELDDDGEDVQVDKTASIGALAGAAAVSDDETETIEFDNLKVDDAPAAPKKSGQKQKKFKIPNFERFRNRTGLAILGVILLFIGWIVAFIVMPRANITIKTDTSSIVSSFDFTASVNQPDLDVNDRKIPAKLKETKKADSLKVPATGEKNNGKKAEGTASFQAKVCAPNLGTTPQAIPAGSTVVSNGKSFITQESLSFSFDSFVGGNCANYETDSGEIVAAEQGTGSNVANGSSFTVANRSGVTGTGSASGGTDEIVKVVTQKDVDDALAQMTQQQSSAATDELKAMIESDGLLALEETMVAGEAKTTATPEVGKEAPEVTVNSETIYTMLGVKRDELAKVIEGDIKDEIDLSKQGIVDDGIDAAIMRINNNTTPGEAFISFRTSVTAGPEIDEQAIKEAVRGKKRGEVESHIESIPGVQEAVVEYSPFWVYSTPKAAKKITITIEKPDNQQAENNSGNE